jgi:hypothetical protein
VYAEKHGCTLFEAIKGEMSGMVKDATLFLLGMKIEPFVTIAKLIRKR